MAILDILQTVTPTPTAGATSMTITFSALTPGDIVLFFQPWAGTSTTPPAGVQSYNTGGAGIPCRAFAKVVQAGDPLTWTFTTSPSGRQIWVAHRIEGPFTDLSTLQVSNRTGSASVTAFRILGTDLTVNANTRVFAAIARGGEGAVAFSNGFATVGSNQFAESVATATRLYTAGATDVHTEATWATAAFPNALLLRLQAQAAPPPTSALVIDTQPANSWDGQTIRPAVVVRMTNGATTDTSFTGNVVATRQTGTGTLGGTTTVAAVAGVATFSNLAITGSGAHTLRFTANALTVDSTSFNVATGTGVPGGGAIIIEEAMSSKPIAQGATNVSVEVDASNLADGTAATTVAHNTSGLTVQYWKGENGAVTSVTPVSQTSTGAHVDGGFVHKAGGRYRVDLPDAAFDTLGTVTVAVSGVSGVKFGRAQVIVTAYDPTADNTQAVANAVVEAELNALETYNRSSNTSASITGPAGARTLTIVTDPTYQPIESIS